MPIRRFTIIDGQYCTEEVEQVVINLGRKLAKVVGMLVLGDLSGIVKAVCSGFKAICGLTIGIITGYDKREENCFQ